MKKTHVLVAVLGVAVIAAAVLTLNQQKTLAVNSVQLFPSGPGFYSQWVPFVKGAKRNAPPVANYTTVDEAACNELVDYNSTSTVNARDSYAVSLAGIPDGATITKVAIKTCVASSRRNRGASAYVNAFYRWNGVNGTDKSNGPVEVTSFWTATTTWDGLSLAKNADSSLEIGIVVSANDDGDVAARLSQISATITYTTPTPPPPPPPPAPTSTTLAAPSNLNAFFVSSTVQNRNVLNWQDNSDNETHFGIERGFSSTTMSPIFSTSANVTTANDTNIVPGTTYYYRVYAIISGVVNSGYSNIVSVTVPSSTPTPPPPPPPPAPTSTTPTSTPPTSTAPAAPSNLMSALVAGPLPTSTPSIRLDWTDNSTNETWFGIERGLNASTFSQIATSTVNRNFYSDFSVNSGTTYYYRVRAFGTFGASSYSNVASTTVN